MDELSADVDYTEPWSSNAFHLDLRPLAFRTEDYESEEFDSDQYHEDGESVTNDFKNYADDGAPPAFHVAAKKEVDEKPVFAPSGSSSAEASSDVQQCLDANRSYQDAVQKGIAELTEALERNRELQNELPARLTHQAMRRKKPKMRKNWYHSMVFHHPYFRDVNGMPAPPNEDELTKRANKELDPYISPAMPWTADEHRALVNAVHANLLQQNLEALMCRKEALEERLLSTDDPHQSAELSERKRQLDEKVRVVQGMSLAELLEHSTWPVDWLRIAAVDMRSNRRPFGCEMQWRHLLDVRLNQEAWTEDEEERLCALATKWDERCWDQVAQELNTGRSAFQCALRYCRQHATRLNTGAFSAEEDQRLRALVNRCSDGNSVSWSQVAHIMGCRSKRQLMSRYQRSLDPRLLRGRWAAEEDMMLLVAVKFYGTENWSKVASLLPGRTNSQCREHYLNFFSYEVVAGQYTPWEDQTLVELVEKHGQGCWSQVSRDMPWRTPSSVLTRYKRLVQLVGKDELTVADVVKYNAGPAPVVARARRGQTSAMDRRMDAYRRVCRVIPTVPQREVALKLAKGEGQAVGRDACLRLYQRMRHLLENGRSSKYQPAVSKALNKAIGQYAQPVQRTFVPNMDAYERQEWRAAVNVVHDLHGMERPPADPEVEEVGTVPVFEKFFRMSVVGVPEEFQSESCQLPPLLPPNETTVATFGRIVDRFADGEHEHCWSFLQDCTSFPELSAALDAATVESIYCTSCQSIASVKNEPSFAVKAESAPELDQQACRRCEKLRNTRRNYDVLCGRFISYFFWPLLVDEQNVIDTVPLPPSTRRDRPKPRYGRRKKMKKPWVKAKWAERKREAAEAAAALFCDGRQGGGAEEGDDNAAVKRSEDCAMPSTSWGKGPWFNGTT